MRSPYPPMAGGSLRRETIRRSVSGPCRISTSSPFIRFAYEDLLERLRNVTNVRVVEDDASSTGYRIDIAPFPGWEKLPEW